ncbi:MAG TPA: hypothetical protein VJ464_06835 [Blastocatellia bacterium]|nr:hypothetical protein [Blastocatellia bacterium]
MSKTALNENDLMTEWMHTETGAQISIYRAGWVGNWYECGKHLFNDPQMPLLIKFGFPADATPVVLSYAGVEFNTRYKDFRIEFFGTSGGSWPSGEDRPANVKDDLRAMAHIISQLPDNLSGGIPSLTLTNIWRGRLFMRDSNLYVEQLWNTHDKRFGRLICNVIENDDLDAKKITPQVIKIAGGLALFSLQPPVPQRGGDWRNQAIQKMWADTEMLKRFAILVDELLPTWKFIKSSVYWKGQGGVDRRREWVSEMWRRDEIKLFVAKFPKFTEDLLARAVDPNRKQVNREPLALACYHAALELHTNFNNEQLSIMDLYVKCEQAKPSPSTLKAYYKKGTPLLKQSE